MTFPLPALRCWKQILHTVSNWSVQWQSWQTRYGCRHRIHNDHKPYFLPVAVVLETMVQKTKCWRLWCWNIKLLIRKAKCRCEIMMHTHINNRAGNFGLMLLQTMDLQTSQLIHTVCLLQSLYTVDCERLKNSGYAKNNAYTCQMIPYSNFSSVLAASFSTTHSKSWGMSHGLMLSILDRWCNRLSRFVADENWFGYDCVVVRRTTFLAVARFPAWRNVRTCMFQLGKIHEWFILIWHNTYSYYSILVKSTDFLWYCA